MRAQACTNSSGWQVVCVTLVSLLIQCLHETSRGWLPSDVRLICNSSPFLLRQTSGCVELSGRWMGQGRGGKTWEWHNTDCLCDTLAWFYSAAGNPPMCDGCHVRKVNRHVLLWVLCEIKDWSGFSASLSGFSMLFLPFLELSASLCQEPRPFPLQFTVSVLRAHLRHAWGTSEG